jgi:hypothetical protein
MIDHQDSPDKRRPKRRTKVKVLLRSIERIAGDDFLEDIGMHVLGDGASPTKYEREAYERLSRIYRIVHSLDPSHSCHHVHGDWRKEWRKIRQIAETEIANAD